jgi:hypothetical protein
MNWKIGCRPNANSPRSSRVASFAPEHGFGAVISLFQPGHPRGCLSVTAALACGVDAEPIQQAMVEWRKAAEETMRKRVREQATSALPTLRA